MAGEQLEVLFKVLAVLERLNIDYVIGGSFASSAHGFARATMDIDLLAAINREHANLLVSEIGPEFYADEQSIIRAINERRHFNIIHIDTGFKVDIFVAKPGGFDEKQLERRRLRVINDEPEQKAYVATAEDTILAKLKWYRLGNEVSDRQWQDVIGIIKIQGDRLDLSYLKQWANRLGVSNLLEKALAQGQGSKE
ncbi:MAG TPA: hypothetical protein VF131_24200 [Blastocatellia bacterium]|nr:hypothetical protein [Blastocatellia bacterium]